MLSDEIIDLALRSTVDQVRGSRACRTYRRVENRVARAPGQGRSERAGRPVRPDIYNTEATVGENLRFGTATGPALSDKAMASNPA